MKRHLKIKICGMRDPGNVADVSFLHPDFMGFIFYPLSPRYCGDIDPAIVRSLPEDIAAVAVTVDMDGEEILDLAGRYGFRGVQLHGKESPELCGRLREHGLHVMKAISVKDKGSLEVMKRYEEVVDLLVLDTAAVCKGGSGKKFDWGMLGDADIHMDFMLSGGIGADDAAAISALDHPHLAGVDLNSRFEISPGLKDAAVLRSFLEEIRETAC